MKKGFMEWAAVLLLKMTGWKTEGKVPRKGCVIIGAPHTTNWDLVFALALLYSTRVKFCWLGKTSLFRGPLGILFRRLGGIPVTRSVSGNQVSSAIRVFRENPGKALVIAPEGTRKKAERWRTGFYYIAKGACVPIVLGFIDYPRKTIGYGPAIRVTGNMEVDMGKIRAFYMHHSVGKYPERSSLAVAAAEPARKKAAAL